MHDGKKKHKKLYIFKFLGQVKLFSAISSSSFHFFLCDIGDRLSGKLQGLKIHAFPPTPPPSPPPDPPPSPGTSCPTAKTYINTNKKI